MPKLNNILNSFAYKKLGTCQQYLLIKYQRERERDKERDKERGTKREIQRERESDKERERGP